MNKVRIGFVGAGSMGQMAHLRNYVNIEGCQVVALAELRGETGRLVARRYGIEKLYTDHEEMLAAEKLDAIVAIQPFDRHAVLLPELYGRVKFLLTEKPLAVSVSAAENLADRAAKAGCTHMVGYHKRCDLAVEHAISVIRDWKSTGRMGPLRYVRILMPAGDWTGSGFVGLINAGDESPPLAREVEGGWGAKLPDMDREASACYVSFINYYIHQVNLMRHLLGEPYEVAYADKSGVLLAVVSESGVSGVIEMTPYRTTIDWEESVLVAFEKGCVKIDLPAPLAVNRPGRVETFADPGGGAAPVRTTPSLPWVDAMRNQAIKFVKVCRGEMAPPCDAAEAAEDLKIAREYIRLRFAERGQEPF